MESNKDDSKVFNNMVLDTDDEWGGVDYKNLEAPAEWRYDETTGQLHMLFKENEKAPRLLCSSAKMDKGNKFCRIAVLASSQEVLLWYSNYSPKLRANLKR